MMTKANILKLIILTIVLGCGKSPKVDKKTFIENESIQMVKPNEKLEKEEKQRQIEDTNKIDSLRLDMALNDAFNIVKTLFKTKSFRKQYEFQPDDSSYTINIEILIGKLFNDKQKYFLLRRHIPHATYLSLYKVNENKPEKLIERIQDEMTYIRDTIFDVNGDGHKDFVVHWYPSSGCCLRNVYNVYLNQQEKGYFTQDYEFINPIFSSKEKIIRGVRYGHPGEVGLYKYKWNGLQVDTIEFINPDANNKGQYIKTKNFIYDPTKSDGTVLKTVPKEYHKIDGYDWFAAF